jgi:polysaccharide transporter, PST family
MQADKNNRLVHNFFSLGLAQGIVSSLQLLVIPYVIRKIGADGFGVIAVAQVVIFYLSTFTDYGFNQTAIRKVAIYRNDQDKLSAIFSRVIFSKAILGIVAFLLLLALVLIIPFFRAHTLLYLTAFSFVIGQALLMNWFFQGIEKMWLIVITTFIARILFVAFVFLFIKNKGDDFLFLFFMGMGNVIAGIISILLACRLFKLKLQHPGRAAVVRELKEGWHFTVTNLSMNTCQYANIFFLRLFTNDLIVGYFSIAERIYFTLKQVLAVFSQSVYPRVCQLVEEGKNQALLFLKKSYIPFLICVTAGSILLIILSPQVLFFFSGKEAVHSVFILRSLSIVLVIVCLSIPPALILLAVNQKKNYFRIYTLGGITNIAANLILVYYFQTTGSIIAIFITEIFITAGVFFESSRPGVLSKIKEG